MDPGEILMHMIYSVGKHCLDKREKILEILGLPEAESVF